MVNKKKRRISYWWPLAKSLAAFFNAQMSDEVDEDGNLIPLFEKAHVYNGTLGKSREFPFVEIGYESEGEIPNSVPLTGVVTLTIDIGVESDDEKPETAYVLQDDLQGKVLSCIPEWPRIAREEIGIAPNVTIREIVSDGDIYRPTSLARIYIDIEWRKTP